MPRYCGDLGDENKKLKQLIADPSLDKHRFPARLVAVKLDDLVE